MTIAVVWRVDGIETGLAIEENRASLGQIRPVLVQGTFGIQDAHKPQELSSGFTSSLAPRPLLFSR